jgi:hypothetical protein
MPDIIINDLTVNPENGWGKGRAYAGEWTTIRFTFGNFGERATQLMRSGSRDGDRSRTGTHRMAQ